MRIIQERDFYVNGLEYTIRSAKIEDAEELSELRLQIDGETENLDREKGEGFISPDGFKEIIKADTDSKVNLFLVASVQNRIVGYLRCEGHQLKRFSHKVVLGICILKEFWSYGIGGNLLKESIEWADTNGIRKISLNVVESNEKAILLYQKFGFEIEGVLKKDRIHSDGNYYSTIMMGRFFDSNEKEEGK